MASFRNTAKALVKKNRDPGDEGIGYRDYLYAVAQGQRTEHLLKVKGSKGKGAKKARQDLIDDAGKVGSADPAKELLRVAKNLVGARKRRTPQVQKEHDKILKKIKTKAKTLINKAPRGTGFFHIFIWAKVRVGDDWVYETLLSGSTDMPVDYWPKLEKRLEAIPEIESVWYNMD